jgi:hypothetical protein
MPANKFDSRLRERKRIGILPGTETHKRTAVRL